jgi:putative oxidoreductase
MDKLLYHPYLAALILRLGLAAVFITMGYMKITMDNGTNWDREFGLPASTQALVAWGEFVGGIALALGFLTRLAALGIAVVMIGAIATVTGKLEFIHIEIRPGVEGGFDYTKPGYAYNVAIIAMCLALVLLGAGLLSLDHLIFRRKKAQ